MLGARSRFAIEVEGLEAELEQCVVLPASASSGLLAFGALDALDAYLEEGSDAADLRIVAPERLGTAFALRFDAASAAELLPTFDACADVAFGPVPAGRLLQEGAERLGKVALAEALATVPLPFLLHRPSEISA